MARSLNQILANENPKVVSNARKKANNMLFEIRLSELRERMHKTQQEIADRLGVTQPTVAALESRGNDMKISSLKQYIEAIGGEATLDVKLPDGTHFAFAI